MAADDKQGSCWQTVPGIITGVATLLGSIAVLLAPKSQCRSATPDPSAAEPSEKPSPMATRQRGPVIKDAPNDSSIPASITTIPELELTPLH
jgi:hypothetical protein